MMTSTLITVAQFCVLDLERGREERSIEVIFKVLTFDYDKNTAQRVEGSVLK